MYLCMYVYKYYYACIYILMMSKNLQIEQIVTPGQHFSYEFLTPIFLLLYASYIQCEEFGTEIVFPQLLLFLFVNLILMYN